MKRVLFMTVGLAMLSLQLALAQSASYQPIFTAKTHWDLYVIDYATGNIAPATQATIKDTSMNAQQYMVFAEDNSYPNRNVYVREDVATQKVYIMENGVSRLLYDFTLQKGDIFEFSDLQFKVVSVENMLTGEGFRKRIELKCTSKLADNLVWIEGVGATSAPLYHKSYASPQALVKVSCFFRANALVYSLSDFPCSAPLAVRDINPSGLAFGVSPNPFSNELQINVKNPLNEEIVLQLLDMTGKLIYSETLQEAGQDIDMKFAFGGLPSGIYILNINTAQSTVNQKVIKK